jgi:hypothetical protein
MGNDMKNAFRLQSAMEYLMTYGWAILIIAVVLGVLFQMGVFNSSSLTVRAPGGACKVLRTSAAVNLVGQCSGILPKYVAQFDGQSSYIKTSASLQKSSSETFSAWVSMASFPTNWPVVCGFVDPAIYIQSPSGKPYVQWSGSSVATSPLSLNTWTFVLGTLSYDGSTSTTEQMYINGTASGTPNVAAGKITGTSYFSIGGVAGQSFNGFISNVQLYNTSLDSSQIQSLYLKGIGGAPVDPSHLVGWWPLNGDTKDYGGNNNGVPTSITFTAQYGK